MKFELDSYKGYDITRFRDNIRFAEVILNRGGSPGGLVALYFNGKVCEYRELPRPDDTPAIEEWYSRLRQERSMKTFFLKIKKLIKSRKPDG